MKFLIEVDKEGAHNIFENADKMKLKSISPFDKETSSWCISEFDAIDKSININEVEVKEK